MRSNLMVRCRDFPCSALFMYIVGHALIHMCHHERGERMAETPYIQAASILPRHLRTRILALDAERLQRVEEFRLRRGQNMTLLLGDGEHPVEDTTISEDDLRTILEQVSRHSVHTVLGQVRSGFLSVPGGHRIGLCGEATMREGELHTLSHLSSLSIRIARPIHGLAHRILPELCQGETPCSTLILAPPGAGKTTLLRDLIRAISNGEGCPALRVGVADERGELAAMWEGSIQLDVGRHTDVMSGCPKAQGMAVLLRGMNPQVLAVDEITAEEDIQAITWAVGCGVTLLATAHGSKQEDLRRRPLYRPLLEGRLFQRLLTVERRKGQRIWSVEVLS